MQQVEGEAMDSLEGKSVGDLNVLNPNGPVQTWDVIMEEIMSRIKREKDPNSKTPKNPTFREVQEEITRIRDASKTISAHQANIRAMMLTFSVPCGTERFGKKQAI